MCDEMCDTAVSIHTWYTDVVYQDQEEINRGSGGREKMWGRHEGEEKIIYLSSL